jgi:5-methylcytosine-specific restriction endonuclease McrA
VIAVKDALLANAAYQVITRVSWQRAITLVVMDLVDVVENHPSHVIHSAGGLAIPLPTIVRQRRYVHAPGLGRPRGETATRAGVMKRDRWTCGYCGGKASTIDHVMPRSRNGSLTCWTNLVAAYEPCNSEKGDRTPVEWGRNLLWMPDQERVWLALSRVA